MRTKNVSNKALNGFAWRFAERCGAQGVTFIVSIILARLLAPELYGTIALVTVFTSILQVFIDSGMANALIQKKDADDLDFSTVFYFNFTICILLYICLFLLAPFIAKFYNQSTLVPIIRVLGLTLIISGVKNVQQAYVSKNMLFKRFFFSTLGGTIGAAVVGIVMAYLGFGVWALVAQQMLNAIVDTLILWVTVKWRPKKCFSFKRLKSLLSYGWKLLASALLDVVYNNIRQLIIGRMYSPTDLAYYNKGQQFPNLAITNLNVSIDSVLFPVMSAEQENKEKVKSMTRKSIQTSSYIIWPIMVLLAVCAEPLINLLLTEKWLPCVPFMQLFCFSYALWPVHTANLNAIKAIGKSDIFLKLEVYKKVIGVLSILLSLPFGVIWIAAAYSITGPINAVINATPNKKLLNYSYKEQFMDMFPAMFLSVIMGVLIYIIGFININDILLLLIQSSTGFIIYIALSKYFKINTYEYAMSFIKNIKRHTKK